MFTINQQGSAEKGRFSFGSQNSLSLKLGKTEDCKEVAHHGFRPLIGTDSIGIDTVGHRAVSKIIERSI